MPKHKNDLPIDRYISQQEGHLMQYFALRIRSVPKLSREVQFLEKSLDTLPIREVAKRKRCNRNNVHGLYTLPIREVAKL